uniref:Single-pass membrane and coiled-coil domain-containing protein 4 n=1 Tax=Felis catus TaxID=9685 RepID=A0ABI7XHQ8_FELCA
MRQLKGKPKKETSKDKKERKQAMQEARQQITTVVLPTLAVVVLLIVVFVYVATRPTVTDPPGERRNLWVMNQLEPVLTPIPIVLKMTLFLHVFTISKGTVLLLCA